MVNLSAERQGMTLFLECIAELPAPKKKKSHKNLPKEEFDCFPNIVQQSHFK